LHISQHGYKQSYSKENGLNNLKNMSPDISY